MARTLMLLGVTVCLCALQAAAYVTDEEFKQALMTLRELEDQPEDMTLRELDMQPQERNEQRSIVDCKAEGEGCTGIIHCCGTLKCYWERGWSAFKKGECVQCVKQGQKCQVDKQCCQGPQALQCNKSSLISLDGTCEVYRSSGRCYRDGQCVNDCKKKWYQTHGNCE